MSEPNTAARLLDAIELIHLNRRKEAHDLLKEIISMDSDSEEAWLWMSVAVDSTDKSVVCLENVLRINPENQQALDALYHLKQRDFESENHRHKLRQMRDFWLLTLWVLMFGIVSVSLFYFCLFIQPFMGTVE